MLLHDARRLWRADRGVLLAIAGPFLFLPALAVNLLLFPALDRATAGIAPDNGPAQLQAFSAWAEASMPWMLAAQVLIQFGGLTTLLFYLDRDRLTVGGAMRRALRGLPIYLLAMVLVSIFSMAGLLLLVVGVFYLLARLSMVGPVIAAEREANPLAAIARSFALTRGSGIVLTGIFLLAYGATFFAQAPFGQIREWIVVHSPNPITATAVGAVTAALSAACMLALLLVQVAAYRRFTAR